MMLDLNTLKLIGHQAARRRYWLSQSVPDRTEAEACHKRIDDILDRRPRPHAVATDGEVILNDQSPNVLAQVDPTYLEPSAGEPLSGGGVAVLDRPPNDPTECLTAEQEAEVRRWGRQLGGL